MMRTGMLLTDSPAGVAAKGTSPSVEKFVVLPRSPTVMDGHDRGKDCAFATQRHAIDSDSPNQTIDDTLCTRILT